MAKKEIEQLEKRVEGLEKRVELLEMQLKELKSVDPEIIDQRFKSIEDTLYSTKDILNMKEVCQYLDISQSLLYKLTTWFEVWNLSITGKFIKETLRYVQILTHLFHVQDVFGGV